jgi:hypothetical protein
MYNRSSYSFDISEFCLLARESRLAESQISMPAKNLVAIDRNAAMPIKHSIALADDGASDRAGTAARLKALGFIAAASSSANQFILVPIASASPPA